MLILGDISTIRVFLSFLCSLQFEKLLLNLVHAYETLCVTETLSGIYFVFPHLSPHLLYQDLSNLRNKRLGSKADAVCVWDRTVASRFRKEQLKGETTAPECLEMLFWNSGQCTLAAGDCRREDGKCSLAMFTLFLWVILSLYCWQNAFWAGPNWNASYLLHIFLQHPMPNLDALLLPICRHHSCYQQYKMLQNHCTVQWVCR